MFYPLLQPSLSFVRNVLKNKNKLNTDYRFAGEFNFRQFTMDMFTVTQRMYLIHIHISSISVFDSVEKQTSHLPPGHGITSDLHSSSLCSLP